MHRRHKVIVCFLFCSTRNHHGKKDDSHGHQGDHHGQKKDPHGHHVDHHGQHGDHHDGGDKLDRCKGIQMDAATENEEGIPYFFKGTIKMSSCREDSSSILFV